MTKSRFDHNAMLARSIIEAAPIGIFTFDCHGRVTLTNRAQLRINHIPDETAPDAFIGISILDHNPIIVDNDLLDPLHQVLQGKPFEVEREAFHTRTGHDISVHIQGVPLYDAAGLITGGLIMVEDITAHVNNQQELKRSEARYRHLVEALPDMILRMDGQGRFIDYEKTSEEWYVPPEQFLNRTVEEIMPPDIAQRTLNAIEAALGTNTAQAFEYFLDWNDRRSYYEARLVPDRPNEVFVVIRNVTEQKEAEQELIESERRFRSLAEAMPDMMFHLDHEGTYIDFHVPPNAGYFEPTPQDIIGKKIADIIPAEAAGTALPRFYEASNSGKVTFVEYSIQEDHGLRHYECRFSPTANQEVIAVVRDITEKRKHERLLNTIAELTNLMLAAGGSDRATMEAALEQLGGVLNANSVLVFEVDPLEPPERTLLSLRGRWTDSLIQASYFDQDRWHQRPWPASILPWASLLAQGTGVRVALTLPPDDALAVLTGLLSFSALIVPVPVDGVWGGMLLFADQQTSRLWTQDDESALTTMAASIGGIIQRSRVEDFLRHEREKADILREVGTAVSSTLDLSEISERLLYQIRRIVDFDAASVVFFEQDQAHTVAHTGFDRFGLDSDTIRDIVLRVHDMPMLQHILTTRQPQIYHDVTANGADQVPAIDLAWLRAWIGVPIVAHGDSVIGAFLLTSTRPGLYDKAEELLPVITTIAQQAAIAIENAQLYAELQRRNNELLLLQQAGRAVLSDLKLDEMLLRLAHQMVEIAHVTGVIVCQYATDTLTGIVEASVQQSDEAPITTGFAPHTVVDASSPIVQSALQTADSRVVPRDELAEAFPNAPLLMRAQWVVIIPLRGSEQIRGFVLLCNHSQNHTFRQSNITICEALADQVAIMLEQARLFKDIHALERIKSRMIDMASHDLRGPLTRISNVLNTLASDLPSFMGEQQQSIEMACRAAADLEDMIRKLLSLKRIEEQHKKAEPILWPDIIQSALDSQHADIIARQQTLTLAIEPDLPTTHGDPVQLVHALSNLVQNAIKFTPPHGEITVRGYVKDYGGRSCVAVEVQDTGDGIPADLQDDLFTPFYRAQYEDSPEVPGTGLGLWIVKAAIEDHHGSVYFDSIPHQGSMFGFWVPVE